MYIDTEGNKLIIGRGMNGEFLVSRRDGDVDSLLAVYDSYDDWMEALGPITEKGTVVYVHST